jgi:hypothetical protein
LLLKSALMPITCTSPADAGIIFRPRFDYSRVAPDLPPDHPNYARAAAAVSRWVNLFGLDPAQVGRTADFEDWHESASMLFASVDSGLPVYAMARPNRDAPGGLGVFARINSTGSHRQNHWEAPTAPPVDLDYIILGNPLVDEPLFDGGYRVSWPMADADDRANRYFENQAFARHAGRAIGLAWSYAGDNDEMNELPDALVKVIQKICRETGGHTVTLKVVNAPKVSTVITIPVPDVENERAINQSLFDIYDYGLLSMGGGRPRFLVQETLDLRYEYRVVIVDGKPICGAGCIESAAPLDNTGQVFHPMVEDVRNEGRITTEPGLVACYAMAARLMADDLIANGAPPHFVIDLAWVPEVATDGFDETKGRIVMIEANPCDAFGLYAMATDQFVKAATRAALSEEAPVAKEGARPRARRRCC